MSTRKMVLATAIVAALGGAGYGLWWLGMSQGMSMMSQPMSQMSGADSGEQASATQDPSTWTIPQGEEATRRHMKEGIKAGDLDPVTGLKVLYYHDPMVPGRNFDAPSKSPFMDMMLVPQYAGGGSGDNSTVQISSRVQQNLGIRSAKIGYDSLTSNVYADGTVGWNERDRSVLQARARGFVEDLRVTAELDRVRKGQVLFNLYVPEWVAAQQEYLALLNMDDESIGSIRKAARQRMLQVGMTDAMIMRIEQSGKLQERVAIVAPRDGVVTGLAVRQGMTVSPGMTMVEINGIDTVWVEAEIPESQSADIKPGAMVRATSGAYPESVFEGQVQAILPQVNMGTRTVKARLEISNPDGRLLPGMFVQTRLTRADTPKSLVVPSEAIIYTGKRSVVMLAEEDGRFRPVEVKTGQEGEGKTVVLSGLQEGQRVALSGQFLIDSEASLRGLEARLAQNDQTGDEGPDLDRTYTTKALFEYLDSPGELMLTHPPIDELKWPEMTMQFELPPDLQKIEQLEEGQELEIDFKLQEGGVPMITRLKPLGKKGQP